jgi:uncharacterized lipoprotein NlpE involved in copper resistance
MVKFVRYLCLLGLTLIPLLLTACQGGEASKFTGVYQAVLPSAETAGRRLTLTLNADNTATITNDYMDEQPPVVDAGDWSEAGDTVTVRLTERNGEPRPETAEVTFQLYEDRLFLTAFEPEDYLPSVGLQLKKIR